MYPVYWTTSKRGIFMRYSYEFKKECVELYRQGKWMETPEGIGDSKFHVAIRKWYRLEESSCILGLENIEKWDIMGTFHMIWHKVQI